MSNAGVANINRCATVRTTGLRAPLGTSRSRAFGGHSSSDFVQPLRGKKSIAIIFVRDPEISEELLK
jgi:hypothetical protein